MKVEIYSKKGTLLATIPLATGKAKVVSNGKAYKYKLMSIYGCCYSEGCLGESFVFDNYDFIKDGEVKFTSFKLIYDYENGVTDELQEL